MSSNQPGYSRKAQFSLFTGYVAAIMGALIGLLLLGLSIYQPRSFSDLRGIAQDLTRPAGEGAAIVRTERIGFWETLKGYLDAGSQNVRLSREIALAEIKLEELQATSAENERLRALLEFETLDQPPVVNARLIGSSVSSTRRFAYLGAGRKDGVAVGMPVRSERGVIGRILEVSAHTSRVLLLTDSQSILPVRLARRNVAALANGRGDGFIEVRLISMGRNPLKAGDLLVTSGTGGYYQPGIAAAIISEVREDSALARLVADPAHSNFVAVMPIWQPEAVFASQTPPDEVLQDESGEARAIGTGAGNGAGGNGAGNDAGMMGVGIDSGIDIGSDIYSTGSIDSDMGVGSAQEASAPGSGGE